MKKKTNLVIIILLIPLIILCITTIKVVYLFINMNDIEWRSDQNYYSIIVDEVDNADYNVFLNPQGKFIQLSVIDVQTRSEIAEFMKNNNLKLKSQQHNFRRFNYNYEELICDNFEFEKIK